MGWLGESEFNCPECDGEGEVECCDCGSEIDCDHCAGTGWDADQVDITAFIAAEGALNQKIRDAGSLVPTHEGIDRTTNTRWGRDGGKYGRVAVIDYLT